MFEKIKKQDIKKIFPIRAEDSHKGDNGRMIIVGGSIDYYGAPVLSALGALYSGVDLIYMFVPECNFEVTRSIYPDFIVRKFSSDYFNEKAIPEILDMSENCQSLLIGPGVSDHEGVLDSVAELVGKLKIPTVLDSEAIQVVKRSEMQFNQEVLVTPHTREFEKLMDQTHGFTDEEEKITFLKNGARKFNVNILLKGQYDLICTPAQDVFVNETGNPGMTVGGSGDVLSGLIAGLIAQGVNVDKACMIGAYVHGQSGENLFRQKFYSYSATDLALEIPFTINQLMQ